MKNLTLCVMLIGCLVSGGCSSGTKGQASANGNGQATITVETAKPDRRDLQDQIELAATVVPDEQVTVYARLSGYLKSIDVDIGTTVRRGQTIAVLEAPEMDTQLAEKRAALLKARAVYEQANVAVDQMRAEAEFAEINHKRLKAIHDRDADLIPQQDVDQARAALGVATSKREAAKAQVKVSEAAAAAAQAELATLEAMMKYARIEAPISGVVTERFVDAGDLIQTAAASRTQSAPIVSVARMDRVRVVVDVPEVAAAQVRAGTPAAVRIEGLAGEPISARVTRVARALHPASRTMRTEIDLPNRSDLLRPGATAKVSLTVRSLRGALTIPVAALRTEGPERVIYRVEGGAARRVVVETGLQSPEWIQVAGGLKGGEEVIVQSSGALRDGAPVRSGK